MRRRRLLMILATAAAAPRLAFAAQSKTLPLDKAFPYLSAYLGLPAAQRSQFYLAYRAVRDKHPAADARATLVAPNGVRTPIAFDRAGFIARLPSLGDLRGGASIELDGAPFQLGVELRCAMACATKLDVAALSQSLAQVNQDVVRFAGALSFVVPKFTAAYFPDAGQALAVLVDGRTAGLPVYAAPLIGPVPYIEPAAIAGAKTVVLARAPSRILLGGHPKRA